MGLEPDSLDCALRRLDLEHPSVEPYSLKRGKSLTSALVASAARLTFNSSSSRSTSSSTFNAFVERCPDTFLVAFANALLPMGEGRRVNCVFLPEEPGEPEPVESVATVALVRTDDRFLIDSGSIILGGFVRSVVSTDALGVVSVLRTLVGSNGWRLLRGMGVLRYTWRVTAGVDGNGALTSVVSNSLSKAGMLTGVLGGLVIGRGEGLLGPIGRRSDLSEELRDRDLLCRSGLPNKGDCARIVGVVDLIDLELS